MRSKILKFMIWLHENHIQEDWEVYKPFLRVVVWPAWFVKAFFTWLCWPLFSPGYLFRQSKVYKMYNETGIAPTPKQMKQIQQANKANTRNFLNGKR
jgi:hypothetical protein